MTLGELRRIINNISTDHDEFTVEIETCCDWQAAIDASLRTESDTFIIWSAEA